MPHQDRFQQVLLCCYVMEYCRGVDRNHGGDFELGPIMGELDFFCELIHQLEMIKMEQGKDPNSRQVGGSHYEGKYQHWDLVAENLGAAYFPALIMKYVTRWRKKNGAEDVDKAIHFCDKLIWLYEQGIIDAYPPPREPKSLDWYAAEYSLIGVERDIFRLCLTYTRKAELDDLRTMLVMLLEHTRRHSERDLKPQN